MAVRPSQISPGREVDLLLAHELLGPAARTSTLPETPGLHVCPDCRLPFVVPGAIHEVIETSQVRLDLECRNCGWTETAVHDDSALAELDIQLDRSYADLLWTLEVVWIANEESAIERFATALTANAILPEDF